MRVEPFEKNKLDLRREYAKEMFKLFPAYLPTQSRAQFQEDTQVKYLPYYAYEEILATFGNRPGESESTSLLAPAERLATYLTDYLPGDPISRMEASEYLESRRQSVLAIFEGKQVTADQAQLLIQSADAAWAGLRGEDERIARRALLRLVRVADAGEQGGDTRLLLRLSEFDRAAQAILRNLGATPLVTIERDMVSGEAAIQLSNDELLRNWPLLQSWIHEDREFLLWRQKLNIAIAEWKSLNEDSGAMLTGGPLELAKDMKAARAEDLNENEIVYIDRCVYEDEQRKERERRHADERSALQQQTEVLMQTSKETLQRRRLRAIIVSAVVLLSFAAIGWREYKQTTALAIKEQLTQKAAAATAEGDREEGRRNFDKAIEKYDEAVSLDPSFKLAYYSRGRVYLERRQLDEAIEDFDAVIRLDENYAEAHVGRGDVYWQKRDLANALAAYNRAIQLKSNLSDAYVNRGKVLSEQRNLKQALADYDRAIELSSDNPNAYLWRGDAYSRSGAYDRALSDFNQALKQKPDLSEAKIKRADALIKRGGAGDNEQAINDINTALIDEVTYDPAPFLNRGKAHKNTGNAKLARDDFNQAIKLSQGKSEYTKIKEEASAQLQQLQPKQTPTPLVVSVPPVIANPTIYLRYRDTKDLSIINRIATALDRLSNSKYKVASGYQQITLPTTGDVHYFYQEDAEAATKIKDIVNRTLRASRIPQTLELKPNLKYGKRPPQGWIEVWLPSLPPPVYRPGIKNDPAKSAPEGQQQSYKPIKD
jgi:tetratricopeptide (TPR) repeat protein